MSAGRATDALHWRWHDRYDGFSVSLCIGRHAGNFNAVGEHLEFSKRGVEGARYLRVADVWMLDDEAICALAAKAFESPAPPDGWHPASDDAGKDGGM